MKYLPNPKSHSLPEQDAELDARVNFPSYWTQCGWESIPPQILGEVLIWLPTRFPSDPDAVLEDLLEALEVETLPEAASEALVTYRSPKFGVKLKIALSSGYE